MLSLGCEAQPGLCHPPRRRRWENLSSPAAGALRAGLSGLSGQPVGGGASVCRLLAFMECRVFTKCIRTAENLTNRRLFYGVPVFELGLDEQRHPTSSYSFFP